MAEQLTLVQLMAIGAGADAEAAAGVGTSTGANTGAGLQRFDAVLVPRAYVHTFIFCLTSHHWISPRPIGSL